MLCTNFDQIFQLSFRFQKMGKENLLKLLTKNEDGVLKSLNDLSLLGRNFFYCCLHLLLNSPEKSQNLNVFQKILPTFHYLSQNKNIDINRSNILKILSNFVNNGGSFIETRQKIQIIKNEENQNHSFDKENGSNLDQGLFNQCYVMVHNRVTR